MLGFAPDSVVGPGGDFPLQSPQPASLDEWLRRARVNNPSARAAREAVSVAQAELDQAKSEYWHTVRLVASYSNADSENLSTLSQLRTTIRKEERRVGKEVD